MDSQEFVRWLAFDRVEPLGRDWLQAGVICATVANLLQGIFGGKRKRAWTAEDFMPLVKAAAKKKQTPQEMEAVFRMATAMHTSRTKGRRQPIISSSDLAPT